MEYLIPIWFLKILWVKFPFKVNFNICSQFNIQKYVFLYLFFLWVMSTQISTPKMDVYKLVSNAVFIWGIYHLMKFCKLYQFGSVL